MARYLIETPHGGDECLKVMDSMAAQGTDVLNKFEWACPSGEHKGFAIVDAGSEEEACQMLPSELRGTARCIALEKFRPEQIRTFRT